MKRALAISVVVCQLLLVGHSSAWAFGMGFFGSLADRSSDWKADGVMRTSDMKHNDFGLTFDTNLATDRLFNYRLEVGKAETKIQPFFDTFPPAKLELDGYVMNHDFGFGMQISPSLRFWFGPELRFTWLESKNMIDPNVDLNLFGWGFGAATGLNINFPGPLTVGIKGGYVVMNYRGKGNYYNSILNSYPKRHYDVDEDLAYVTVMLMFRTDRDR